MLQAALAETAVPRAAATSRVALADLLRHGFASDYLGNWGRCAPCGQRWQEVTVFALLAEGAWRYDTAAHELVPLARDDLRPLARGPEPQEAPVAEFVYVVDCDRVRPASDEEHGIVVASDPGTIAARIEKRSRAGGLHANVHGIRDRRGLAHALGLGSMHLIAFAQSLATQRRASESRS